MARNSFGAIEKRSNGRYRARYIDPETPWKPNGKRNYIYGPETYATKSDARAWLATVQAEIANGTWKSPEQIATEQAAAERARVRDQFTFGQYADQWQEMFNLNPRKARKTKDNYSSVIRNHLLPTFADMPLTAIDRERILSWAREPFTAPKARTRAFETLRKILNDAVEDQYLTGTPITPRLTESVLTVFGHYTSEDDYEDAPQVEDKALDVTQVQPFLDSMLPAYQLIAEVLIHSGMRSGEARALRGTDAVIHLDSAVTLTVARAVKETESKGRYEGATKTRNTRSLTLTGDLGRRLADHIESMDSPTHLIFPKPGTANEHLPERTLLDNCQRAGTGYSPWSKTPQDRRRKVCQGIGRTVTVHELRNTYAAIARAAGIDHSQRQYQLGHKPADMTEVYEGSTQLAEQKAMADKFTAYLDQHGGKIVPVSNLDARREVGA